MKTDGNKILSDGKCVWIRVTDNNLFLLWGSLQWKCKWEFFFVSGFLFNAFKSLSETFKYNVLIVYIHSHKVRAIGTINTCISVIKQVLDAWLLHLRFFLKHLKLLLFVQELCSFLVTFCRSLRFWQLSSWVLQAVMQNGMKTPLVPNPSSYTEAPPPSLTSPVISIIGSGDFSRSLSIRLVSCGFRVVVGSRDPDHVDEGLFPEGVELMSQREAVQAADKLVFIAVFPEYYHTLLDLKEALDGKVLVDVSNAERLGAEGPSNAERLAEMFPKSSVVKGFNVVSAWALQVGAYDGSRQVRKRKRRRRRDANAVNVFIYLCCKDQFFKGVCMWVLVLMQPIPCGCLRDCRLQHFYVKSLEWCDLKPYSLLCFRSWSVATAPPRRPQSSSWPIVLASPPWIWEVWAHPETLRKLLSSSSLHGGELFSPPSSSSSSSIFTTLSNASCCLTWIKERITSTSCLWWRWTSHCRLLHWLHLHLSTYQVQGPSNHSASV